MARIVKRLTAMATKTTTNKKKRPSKKAGVGAHGSREKPKTGEGGNKWPGGGKKGEDE
jgi:hypothetical protein